MNRAQSRKKWHFSPCGRTSKPRGIKPPRSSGVSSLTKSTLFRLAEHSGVVLMHGGSFGGPEWSVRVSLANLREDTYPKIGQYLKEAAEGYVEEWKAASVSERSKKK